MKNTAILALLAISLSLMACDDYFSSSWGSPRKYNASNINVNAGNVDRWIEIAIGNPELALAVAEKIADRLNDPSLGEQEKAKLLEGGIRLAVEASGIGVSIISHAGDLLGEMNDAPSEETLRDILGKVQEDFNKGHGNEAAELITQMVSSSLTGATDGEAPQFIPAYADAVQPADVAEAILVLVLGELDADTDIDEALDDIEVLTHGLTVDSNGMVVVDSSAGGDPSPTALTLAAYLNLVNSEDRFNDNPLTSAIRELGLFGHNNDDDDE